MCISLFAVKETMSQTYINNNCVPITLLRIRPTVVINKIVYTSPKIKYVLQIGCCHTTKIKSKPKLGYFNKQNVVAYKYLKECTTSKDVFHEIKIGDVLDISKILTYKYINITGITKGKGFAGVMKRHNFSGAPASHGTHEYFRHGGSIGCSAQPSKVFKGKKMPGHLGNKRFSRNNILLMQDVIFENYLPIKGAVPGCKGNMITIHGHN